MSVPKANVPPSLSVVVPVYNGAGWIAHCLEHVARAVEASPITDVEIIVVNDGSTDTTATEAQEGTANLPLRVIDQPNLGRFRARRTGLAAACKEFVLLIDTRVLLDRDALAFVAESLHDPDSRIWTAHVAANTAESRYAGFWQAIEHVAWRRYFRHPRTTSYGLDEFDYYPKGTTALIGPRQLLVDAWDAFQPTIKDWRKANDDTAVLRWVAARTPINISPCYSCTYNARRDLKSFLNHANHRGTVLIDGYLRPGARFAGPIIIVLATSPFGLWFALRHPVRAATLAGVGAGVVGLFARGLGARREDAFTLAIWSVPFSGAYLAGMWRGVFLRFQALRRPVANQSD
jgi:glycosyltransferase involved in cell wall biosynthesis